MSTKIYTGFVVKGISLQELLRLLQAQRAVLIAKAQELDARWTARRATELFDLHTLGLSAEESPDELPGTYSGMSWASLAHCELEHRKRQVNATGRRDTAVDFSCSVSLFPQRGRILGMAFIENAELNSLWEQTPWRTDYAYWNNTERPDNVTAVQWARRRRDWDKVFEQFATPAEAGYSYELVPMFPWVTEERFALFRANLPSLQERVNLVAMRAYAKENPHVLATQPADTVSAVMMRWREVQKSAEFAAFKTSLEARLPVFDSEVLLNSAAERTNH